MASRLFVPPDRLQGDRLTLDDEGHRHLRVLRVRPGDPVSLFDGEGWEIEAVVESVDARSTVLRLGQRRQRQGSPRPVVLLQAIPKGERMDWLVQKTTELGIARIVPVVTARGVVQKGDGGRVRRWRTIAQEAARQCGRADLPVIDEPRTLAEALVEAWQGSRFVAWEGETTRPLRKSLSGQEIAVTLLVGAEGGLQVQEAAAAESAGFLPVSLGPRILRSETAAVVSVTIVQSALGALD